MDEGVQAAGAMLYVLSESVKLATDLLVATVKTTGSTGKVVAAMLAAHWKNSTQKEMGEISCKKTEQMQNEEQVFTPAPLVVFIVLYLVFTTI